MTSTDVLLGKVVAHIDEVFSDNQLGESLESGAPEQLNVWLDEPILQSTSSEIHMLAQLSDENLHKEVMKIEGFTVDYVLKIMPATTEFAKRNRRLHIASLAVHWKLFVEDMTN